MDPFTIEIWVDVPCEEGLCLGSCWCSGGSCEHQRDEPCVEGTLCVEHGTWSTSAACLPTEGLCGGPDGLTCARGEQCEYALDLCPACLDDAAGCGPGSPLGVCVLSPDPAEVCPELDPDGDPALPQCGCDGLIYPSECDRRKAGVALGGPNACS